ncbi:MAG: RagB/SusD family nutrient uptake outer membrane protein [Odoribacteraceae bacterium]|jgi:hypothetical protein|nr:RagB/SusD family nutrient uptake outer membrane protein [Odoribacteraceae bacterium]
MKAKKYCLIAAVLLVAAACDMKINPEGGTITGEQKDQLAAAEPGKMQSEINGLYAKLIQVGSISAWAGSDRHYDFGYPAACMMFDASGMDAPSENSGYNWFLPQQQYTDRAANSANSYFLWNLFYSHAKGANDIIRVIDPDTDDPTLRAYLGQALAARAFDYEHLVQIYQFTGKGRENDLAIPIVTERTPADSINNNPRATVASVHQFIIDDLTRAISLLTDFDRRGRKECINRQVAYGLRARANLLAERWDSAAADARRAIAGNTPYTIAEVSKPAFNNIAADAWIWGCAITENNDAVLTGIINFPAHMCSLTGNGYSPGFAGRYINKNLWEQIPDDDVRKGWWTDTTLLSPHLDATWTITYNGEKYNLVDWFQFQAPYLNVKFGPYQDIYNNPTNACDFPLMRVEEMILLRAEALAMSGNTTEASQILTDFITAYRQPSYTTAATTPEDLRDEIWFQRRVELWGEGFSLFDLKRLKKPLLRANANYPGNVSFDLPAEAPILLWLIPESEINANRGIQENNPVVPVPHP